MASDRSGHEEHAVVLWGFLALELLRAAQITNIRTVAHFEMFPTREDMKGMVSAFVSSCLGGGEQRWPYLGVICLLGTCIVARVILEQRVWVDEEEKTAELTASYKHVGSHARLVTVML